MKLLRTFYVPSIFILLFSSHFLYTSDMYQLTSSCKKIIEELTSTYKYPPGESAVTTLERITKLNTHEKICFVTRFLNLVIEKNLPDESLLIPIVDRLMKCEEICENWGFFIRDSCLLNYAIFKHNIITYPKNKTQQILDVVKARISFGTTYMDDCLVQDTNYKIPQDQIQCCWRTNGKTFVETRINSDSWEKIIEDYKRIYWETALEPKIFSEKFQYGDDNSNHWNIQTLKKKAFTFLCCLKENETRYALKIPKNIIIYCVMPNIFHQPLQAIENDLIKVMKTVEQYVEASHKNMPCFGEDTAESYSGSQSFFKNFSPWYTKQMNELLSKKFDIVKQLIAHSHHTKKQRAYGTIKKITHSHLF